MQRRFIETNKEDAQVSGALYTNFKEYVRKKYPRGITEADWDNIVVSYNIIIII